MTSYPLSLGSANSFPSPIGGTPTKEGEVAVIRSLHASSDAGAAPISYGYSGVTLSSSLAGISRGDRFQGRFRCGAGVLDGDDVDSVTLDPTASLSLILGPLRLTSAGASGPRELR